MKSIPHIVVEKVLPSFLSKRIIQIGQEYKRSIRMKKRITTHGGDKPFKYHVNTQGLSFDIMLDPVHNGCLDEAIEEFGFWEKELGSILKKYLRKGSVFLDIGGNIGYHTLFAAACLEGSGKVYSFEPIPRLARQLKESVDINGFSNVEVCNFGLAEHDENNIAIYLRDENIGGSSLFRYQDIELVKVRGTEKINVKKLDSFLPETVDVNLIKIDVEGYEYEVLKGAAKLLERKHPVIIMEFSPIFYTQESQQKSYEIISFLEKLGYSFYLLTEEPFDILTWLGEGNNKDSQIDILCKYGNIS